jgi:hypothetical protein
MLRYRQMKSLQKFASVLASFHDHFNLDRHLSPSFPPPPPAVTRRRSDALTAHMLPA